MMLQTDGVPAASNDQVNVGDVFIEVLVIQVLPGVREPTS